MNQYHSIQKWLHAVTGLWILGLFALGIWMRSLGYYDSWYQTGPQVHKALGVLLIAAMLLRLIAKVQFDAPAPLSNHKPWEVSIAKWTHWLIYGLVAIILLSGYLIGTADNRGIDVFGWFEVSPLFEPFDRQEDIAGAIHEYAAYGLISLVILHAMGAIKHGIIDKDSTLKRMF